MESPSLIQRYRMSNSKVARIDSPLHRRFVASQPCLITGYQGERGVDHHLMRAEPIKGIARKVCDRWVVPLESSIHDALHKNGNEISFFANHGLSYEAVKAFAMQFAILSPDKRISDAVKNDYKT